jgi:hypothetical protein
MCWLPFCPVCAPSFCCPAERAELEALRAQQLVCGSEDVGFMRYLAASYVSRGMHQQALQCLQRLTMLSPGESSSRLPAGGTAPGNAVTVAVRHSSGRFQTCHRLGALFAAGHPL